MGGCAYSTTFVIRTRSFINKNCCLCVAANNKTVFSLGDNTSLVYIEVLSRPRVCLNGAVSRATFYIYIYERVPRERLPPKN